MKKIQAFSVLLVLFSFFHFQVEAQSLTEKLTANKWALTSYVEVEGMVFDTLFTAFDCNAEYIHFFKDMTLEDPNEKKKINWEVSADSIISYKKGFGVAYKKSRIALLDGENLVLIDRNKGGGIFYIENYKKCTATNTGTGADTRNSIEVNKQFQLTVGAQASSSVSLTAGVSLLKDDGKKNKTYYNLEAQLNPSDEFYGLSGNVLASNVFLYGAGVSAYTDGDEYQIGLQPVLGVTGKPLGGFGENIQLYYTLIFPFIGERINVVPTHSVGLRINIPVSKSSKQIKRIKQD